MALYNDQFVIILPQKCATTALHAALTAAGWLEFERGDGKLESHHATLAQLQGRHAARLHALWPIAPVRPALQWYRSWYLHQARTAPVCSPVDFRRWLYTWTHSERHDPTGAPMTWHSEGIGTVGLYTTIVGRALAGVRTCLSVSEIDRALSALGIDTHVEPTNEARQPFPPASDLFDAEARRWVATADGDLSRRFDWGSPTLGSPRPPCGV